MAKARMLSQEAAEDSKLGRCSVEAAYTYVLTIPFLDRDGLCSGKPSWIAGRALQERSHLQMNVGAYIQEWIAQGLITCYDGSDGPVLFFHGFRKHNAHMAYEKETHSKFPPPPGFHRTEHGLIPNDPEVAGRLSEAFDSRNTYRKALAEASQEDLHNEVATSSRPHRDQVAMNRREVEVEREGEEEEKESNNNGATLPPARPSSSRNHPLIIAFHELHNRYPTKAQMAAIIEHDPAPEDWRRAIRAWDMAGNNPMNVQGQLDWAFEPSRYESKQQPGKYAAHDAASKGSYLPAEFSDIILGYGSAP